MGDARVKYSVIIPTYNREPLLAEALRSVQAALPDCSEVIVVNDGPAFETPTRDLIKTLGAVAVKTKGGLGAGKSTLLRALAGAIRCRKGTLRHGEGVRVGYFSQDLAQELPGDEPPLTHVLRVARSADPTVSAQTARAVNGSCFWMMMI